jgi:hypothetical protein
VCIYVCVYVCVCIFIGTPRATCCALRGSTLIGACAEGMCVCIRAYIFMYIYINSSCYYWNTPW